jgi:hypothetical protein
MSGSDWYELFVPVFLLGLFVLALFGVYRFKGDLIKAPLLTVESGNEIVTSEDSLTIKGTTEKNVGKLLINGSKVEPDNVGNFTTNVPLNSGQNQIKVVAYNYEMNKSVKEINVTREVKSESVLGSNSGQSQSVTPSTQMTEMSSSGPEENIAVLGISILVTLLVFNYDLKKSKDKHNLALQ